MSDGVKMQQERANRIHGDSTQELWDYHYTSDPLIRYLRDRRLHRALKELDKRGRLDVATSPCCLFAAAWGAKAHSSPIRASLMSQCRTCPRRQWRSAAALTSG